MIVQMSVNRRKATTWHRTGKQAMFWNSGDPVYGRITRVDFPCDNIGSRGLAI